MYNSQAVQTYKDFHKKQQNGITSALNDLADWIGLGSKRREQEYNAEQAEINRQFQTNSQTLQMNFDSAEAEKNRQFQEMQRQTQYQTAVEDMKKAGLNPVMALGSPASPTAGATASSSAMSGSQANSSGAGTGQLLGFINGLLNSAVKIAKYS